MKIVLVTLYDEYCLGARYLASTFAQDGHETHIVTIKGLDYNVPSCVPPPEERDANGYYGFCHYVTEKETRVFLDTVEKIDPAWIGFSFLGINFGLARHLTQALRTRFTDRPIIWGGTDTTVNPDENIQYADILCLGEGEHAMRRFVHAFGKGGDFYDTPNLWFRLGDGEIKKNPKDRLERNLDVFPWPDFDLARKHIIFDGRVLDTPFPPSSHLHTNFMILGSRGCPFTCSYCQSGHSNITYPKQQYLRARGADDVIAELHHRIKNWPTKIERVEFLDDVLPLNPKWIGEMTPLYKEKIGLPFYGYTHPNVCRPESLRLLADAGCKYLIMGIQSGSQRTLREYYDRKHDKDKIIEATAAMRDSGMRSMIDLIGYNPLEVEEDNLETLELLCDLPRPFGIVKINPMAFYDNFRIQEVAEREGIMDELERPEGVHALQAKFKPAYLFWEMMHTIAQFDGFSKNILMDMAQDQYLRQNPQFLVETVQQLYCTTYMDGNPVSPKDDYIGHLRWRLHQIESSTAYKAYRKLKRLRGVG